MSSLTRPLWLATCVVTVLRPCLSDDGPLSDDGLSGLCARAQVVLRHERGVDRTIEVDLLSTPLAAFDYTSKGALATTVLNTAGHKVVSGYSRRLRASLPLRQERRPLSPTPLLMCSHRVASRLSWRCVPVDGVLPPCGAPGTAPSSIDLGSAPTVVRLANRVAPLRRLRSCWQKLAAGASSVAPISVIRSLPLFACGATDIVTRGGPGSNACPPSVVLLCPSLGCCGEPLLQWSRPPLWPRCLCSLRRPRGALGTSAMRLRGAGDPRRGSADAVFEQYTSAASNVVTVDAGEAVELARAPSGGWSEAVCSLRSL